MKNTIRLHLCAALILCTLMGCTVEGDKGNALPNSPNLSVGCEILFINVGKADSALISFDDHHYLIDTGSVESFPALVRALRMQGVEELDGVFLTHTHEDHIGGLNGLLKLFPVRKIYAAEISAKNKKGDNVIEERAQKNGQAIHKLKAGDAIALSPNFPKAKLNVIGPLVYNPNDDNDNSLVMVLEVGPITCLLTGDMQFAEESSLLEAKSVEPCTLLKVANHGNPDASSDVFLLAASPNYAIFSTDSVVETDTPAPTILAAHAKLGTKVFVTQDAKIGIAAKIVQDQLTVELCNGETVSAAQSLAIETLDKKSELIVLRNVSGKAIDLSGWWIQSERGNELFFFPKGSKLQPNKRISIASGKNPPSADLIWEEKNVWHDSKSDSAIVYDAMGNEVARREVN